MGLSMTEVSRAFHLHRASISKGAISFCEENGLPPSSYMKSEGSRQVFADNRRGVGLKQRIQKAESKQDIEKLLQEGSGYTKATEDTKRKWAKAAAKREKELSS